MKKRTKVIIRRVGRAAARGAARGARRVATRANEQRQEMYDMAIGVVVGGAEGYIEADRVRNGKSPYFQLGTDTATSKATNVTVGNVAAVAGAVGVLNAKGKTARRLAAVGTAGAALSSKKATYNYRSNKS